MFSNHININILGSTISESEIELEKTQGKIVKGKFIPSNAINTNDNSTIELNKTSNNKEKLNIHFINYKQQQIL